MENSIPYLIVSNAETKASRYSGTRERDDQKFLVFVAAFNFL